MDEETSFKPSDYDLVFVGCWTVFIGRGNKNVYQVYNELTKKQDLKIYYLFINLDLLEEWNCVSLKNLSDKKH